MLISPLQLFFFLGLGRHRDHFLFFTLLDDSLHSSYLFSFIWYMFTLYHMSYFVAIWTFQVIPVLPTLFSSFCLVIKFAIFSSFCRSHLNFGVKTKGNRYLPFCCNRSGNSAYCFIVFYVKVITEFFFELATSHLATFQSLLCQPPSVWSSWSSVSILSMFVCAQDKSLLIYPNVCFFDMCTLDSGAELGDSIPHPASSLTLFLWPTICLFG